MKICRNCKEQLDERWIVCPFCQTKVKLVCAHCGEELDERFKVCPYCATPVGAASPQPHTPVKAAARPRVDAGISDCKAGDTLKFGTYEQDALDNGKEEVEWIVLDNKKGILLVISKKILSCVSAENAESTWEDSSIRKWLNDDFMNELCAEDETLKDQIVATHINNGSDNGTKDQMFLLSSAEVKKYFASENMKAHVKAEATDFATSQGDAFVGNWLLRDGPSSKYSSFSSLCTIIQVETGGIRPAMWLKPVVEVPEETVDVPTPATIQIPSSFNPDSDREQDDPEDTATK